MNDFKDVVAVVTGSSRGIGKGAALVLGARGATVYVTGRTQHAGEAVLPGTIHQTVSEIDAAGGRGIAVACDHADDTQVAALFQQVRDEHGKLDILVNNAASIAPDFLAPVPFWEKSLAIADMITVGLRSSYVASYYAAPLMLKSSKALIANISFFGSVSFFHDPSYGAHKAGIDKMTWDMAIEFRGTPVSVVSIWPGLVTTEGTMAAVADIPNADALLSSFETPQFTGLVIEALYRDPDLAAKSGHVVIGAEAAQEYGFTDINGRQPPSLRAARGAPNTFYAVD